MSTLFDIALADLEFDTATSPLTIITCCFFFRTCPSTDMPNLTHLARRRRSFRPSGTGRNALDIVKAAASASVVASVRRAEFDAEPSKTYSHVALQTIKDLVFLRNRWSKLHEKPVCCSWVRIEKPQTSPEDSGGAPTERWFHENLHLQNPLAKTTMLHGARRGPTSWDMEQKP